MCKKKVVKANKTLYAVTDLSLNCQVSFRLSPTCKDSDTNNFRSLSLPALSHVAKF